MRQAATVAMAMLFCATRLCAEEAQADVKDVENNYAAAAKKLREGIEERMLDQAVRDDVFATQRMVHEHRAKTEHVKPEPFSDGIVLSFISATPPTLKQDPNDLYLRFHSVVSLKFQRLKPSGDPLDAKPYEITIPVAARPNGEWIFPDERTVINLLTAESDKTASALMEIMAKIEAIHAETKALTREADRERARRAKEKAEVEKYLTEHPGEKRMLEEMRRKYPVKK